MRTLCLAAELLPECVRALILFLFVALANPLGENEADLDITALNGGPLHPAL